MSYAIRDGPEALQKRDTDALFPPLNQNESMTSQTPSFTPTLTLWQYTAAPQTVTQNPVVDADQEMEEFKVSDADRFRTEAVHFEESKERVKPKKMKKTKVKQSVGAS